jgi:hypothetical protein
MATRRSRPRQAFISQRFLIDKERERDSMSIDHPTPHTPQPLHRAIGPIRLIQNGEHWLVIRPDEADDRTTSAFAPFVLPRVPASLASWLTIGGERVWRQRQRCFAALLLLHPGRGLWTTRIPPQHCGPDAARWSAAIADFAGAKSDWRLGGTFQVRALAVSDNVEDSVPAADGVHLAHAIHPDGRRDAITFVRACGAVCRPRFGRVIGCDWRDAIDAAMPRLRLA